MQPRSLYPEAPAGGRSLAGLPACYAELGLVRTEGSQVRLVTDQGAIKEVLDWIRLRCGEGRAPAGKDLEQHFGRAVVPEDLELDHLYVVYPGTPSFPLDASITALALKDLPVPQEI